MRVKKYTAATMNEALIKIKEELGSDAIILNSKPVKSGGVFGLFKKKRIEVIAALDENPIAQEPQRNHATLQREKIEHPVTRELSKTNQDDVLEEIKQLRQLVTSKTFQQDHRFSAPFDTFYSYLLEQDVTTERAVELVSNMENEINNNTMTYSDFESYIKREFMPVIEDPTSINKKVIQFVGPTGVGKTTTIAKVAAKMMLEQKKQVAFITTDTYRIAAIEQLKTYAKILDVPLEVVYTRDDYVRVLDKFKDFDHIFVDTAGRNYREPNYLNELKNMIHISNDDCETYLILSLTAKSSDNDIIYNIFNQIGIKQIIFTKADETTTYGTIINLCIGQHAKIGYMSNGQNVPDDLKQVDSTYITNLILSGYRHV